MKKLRNQLLLFVLLILFWQYLYSTEIWSPYLLPSPKAVAKAFFAMIENNTLFYHAAVSLYRVLTGFFLAFSIAFFLGVWSGLSPGQCWFFLPVLQFLRNIPPISLIPLLILWVGIGEPSKIIMILLASFFPMFLNIQKGISTCDPQLLEVGDVFHYSKKEKLIRIILPYAMPDILVGMRVGLGYGWRAIIGAEMIAASQGLGYLILDAQQLSRTSHVIVGILVIGLIGSLCDKLFAVIIQKLLPGGVQNSWN